MKKILIISNFYYPTQHIATNRMIAFTKYLKEFGYKVTVITKGNKDTFNEIDGIQVYYISDKFFLKRFDTSKVESKIVHYLKCISNILYMNIFENEEYGWSKSVLSKINKILDDNDKYDYILSSAPPIGPHIIAYNIKKKYPEIKWIMDMRDALWSPNYPWKIRNSMLKLIDKMSNVADVLIAVSKPQLKEYIKLTNDKLKYLELRNGYDFDLKVCTTNIGSDISEFTIVYMGSFYGLRKPDNFFKALENLFKSNKLTKFKVEIIGNSAPINIPSSIKENVSILDRMKYEDVIEYVYNKADLLLLISPANMEKGAYTGKLFDYLGLCKPILALVPQDDVAADLINKVNIGYVTENENIKGIEDNILKAYYNYKNNILFKPNFELIKSHHRKKQVERLYKFLETEDIKW